MLADRQYFRSLQFIRLQFTNPFCCTEKQLINNNKIKIMLLLWNVRISHKVTNYKLFVSRPDETMKSMRAGGRLLFLLFRILLLYYIRDNYDFFGMPDKMSGKVNVSLTLSSHRNFLIHVKSYRYMQSLIKLYAITC